MDPNLKNIVSTSQLKSEDDDDFHLKFKKILWSLELNKTLAEQFLIQRQELCKKLEAFYQNEYEDGGDNEPSKKISKRSKLFLQISDFQQPYLRDERGFSAPLLFNPEHDFVLDSHLQSFLIYPRLKCLWKKNDEKIILKEVSSQNLFKKSRSIIKQLEELLKKDSTNRSKTDKNEINRLNTQLALMKTRPNEPERFSSDIDWLSIAKNLSEDDNRTDEDCELYYNNYLHSSINRQSWSSDEDSKLLALVEKHGESNWDTIAQQMGTKRLPWQCCQRYQKVFNPLFRRSGPLTGEESKQLNQLIKEYQNSINGNVNWRKIDTIYEGRSIPQIKYFHKKQQNLLSIKKNIKWSKLEDKLLYACVKYYGKNNWQIISKHFPLRNNRQVRERYLYQISINSNDRVQGDWKPKEDCKLLKLCSEYLKCDLKIDYMDLSRRHFPNRNAHQIFGRFQRLRKNLPPDFYLHLNSSIKKIDEMKLKSRKRFSKKFVPPKLPDNHQQLHKYIITLSNMVSTQSIIYDGSDDDDNVDDHSDCEGNSIIETENFPRIVNPLSELNQQNNNFQWRIDASLQLYTQLEPFVKFFQRRHIFDSNLDLVTNGYLIKVLTELLTHEIIDDDDDNEESLDYCHDEEDNDNSSDESEKEQKPESKIDCNNALTMDTIRFFLAKNSLSINDCYPFNDDDNSYDNQENRKQIRCLFLPNRSTIFGYSILQLMFNAMLIHSAESGRDDFQEDSITQENDYQELRSTFISLFLWPSLLTSRDDQLEEKTNQILLKNIKISVNKDSILQQLLQKYCPTPAIEEGSINKNDNNNRKRGRPKKKKFFKPINEFLQIRSLQKAIFCSKLNYSDLGLSVGDVYDSSRIYWFQPNAMIHLIERVGMFLERIEKDVVKKLTNKNENENNGNNCNKRAKIIRKKR